MPSIFIWHKSYAYSGRNSYINPPLFGKSKISSPYWAIPKSDHLISYWAIPKSAHHIGQFQNPTTLLGNSKISLPCLAIPKVGYLIW